MTVDVVAGFSNPVVRGNAPDPSVIRVGHDFYLATSTFDTLPGVLIRHSTDLVTWSIIGAAVTGPAQYRRDGQPGAVMLYAPTLRHHEGTFYVIVTNVADSQGNFIVHTEDLAGDWSDAVWLDVDAFDPSLLFDNDTCYYTRRTLDPLPDGRLGPVVQAEIDPRTGILGEWRELTPHWGGLCSNDIEGPHLYRIGDWYYLFSAEGGSWKGHMQTCGRSRSPWGPFEPAPSNPVLTHRHRVGHPIQSTGHAELIDDAAGNWWALHLGTRHGDGWTQHHNLGRETFLAPVVWMDGFPVIGAGGTNELDVQLDLPLPGEGHTSTVAVPRTLWRDGWHTIGFPHPGMQELARDAGVDGHIKVSVGTGLSEVATPMGGLFITQTEDCQRFSTRLDGVDGDASAIGSTTAGIRAGIAAFTNASHFYELTVGHHDGVRTAQLRRVVDDLEAVDEVEVAEGPIGLRIEATSESYTFFIIDDGGVQTMMGSGRARLLSAETADAFVGVRFGLVARSFDDAVPATGAASFSATLIDNQPVRGPR